MLAMHANSLLFPMNNAKDNTKMEGTNNNDAKENTKDLLMKTPTCSIILEMVKRVGTKTCKEQDCINTKGGQNIG